jgi:hypothetical protein
MFSEKIATTEIAGAPSTTLRTNFLHSDLTNSTNVRHWAINHLYIQDVLGISDRELLGRWLKDRAYTINSSIVGNKWIKDQLDPRLEQPSSDFSVRRFVELLLEKDAVDGERPFFDVVHPPKGSDHCRMKPTVRQVVANVKVSEIFGEAALGESCRGRLFFA